MDPPITFDPHLHLESDSRLRHLQIHAQKEPPKRSPSMNRLWTTRIWVRFYSSWPETLSVRVITRIRPWITQFGLPNRLRGFRVQARGWSWSWACTCWQPFIVVWAGSRRRFRFWNGPLRSWILETARIMRLPSFPGICSLVTLAHRWVYWTGPFGVTNRVWRSKLRLSEIRIRESLRPAGKASRSVTAILSYWNL